LNILTKISIVVLVVLSLFVSAVFITQASIVPNYKQLYDAQKTQSDINAMTANQREVLAQRLQQDVTQLKNELDKSLGNSNAQKQKFETDLLAVTGERDQARRESGDKQNTLDRLAVAVTSLNARLNTAGDDLKAARTENDRLAKANLDLTQQFQETSARLDREIRQGEFFRSTIADLQKLVKDLQETRPTVAAGEKAADHGTANEGDSRYTGSVTSVRNDLAQINIGSSNGVKKGDKLYVYRDGKFLAYLKIETVDATSSAGIISERQADIKQDDKVTNRLTQ
jgi:hypothetical protein